MSAMPARAARADAPGAPSSAAARAALRLVPTGRSRLASGPFALLVVGILLAGLIALLLLNTVLAQGAFVVNQKSADLDALRVQEQALEQQVAALETPDSLERRARRLGMLPAQTPVFLRVPDGKVLGVPSAAPKPPARPSASARVPAGASAPSVPSATTGTGAAVKAPEAAEQGAAPPGAAADAAKAVGGAGVGPAVPAPEGAEQAAGDGAVPTGPGQ